MLERFSTPTTTITLDREAYELLKSNKRPDESFSEEARRVLSGSQPRLQEFLTLFSSKDTAEIVDAVTAIRRQNLEEERRRAQTGRGRRGHRP